MLKTTTVQDLETQFDDEHRRLVEAEKSQRRTERRIKELTFSQSEDHKNHERMQQLVDKLQSKVQSSLPPLLSVHYSHRRLRATRSRSRRPRRSPP